MGTTAELVQLPFEATTVQFVDELGNNTTFDPGKGPPGYQEQVIAPTAFNETLLPEHTKVGEPLANTTGKLFTTTLSVAVLGQVLVSRDSVQVVNVVGETTTTLPVRAGPVGAVQV